MVRISNNVLGIINIIAFILSIPIFVTGVWLSRQGNTECARSLEKVFVALGVFLMIISIAGIVGACFRVSWILCLYLFLMFVLIILVLCSTIFVLAVTHKGAGKALSGRGYKEYRLGDYSHWLQNRVNNYEKWRRIKTCLQYSKVCMPTIGNHDASNASNAPAHLFYSKRLSAIQSGCCKPPDWCNFTYVSPTYWNKPTEAELPYTTTDCALWQNDPNVLCLDCESCKAGILDNLKSTWKKAAIVNTVFLKCLTVVYAIGCCAFRNTRKDDSWKRPPSGFVVQ